MTDKQEEEEEEGGGGENVESITYGFAVGKKRHNVSKWLICRLSNQASLVVQREVQRILRRLRIY